MANQIIKQPNGLYLLFSTVTDSCLVVNKTKDEMAELIAKAAYVRALEQASNIIETLEHGGKPYFQFGLSYDEAAETIRTLHGADSDEFKEIVTGSI